MGSLIKFEFKRIISTPLTYVFLAACFVTGLMKSLIYNWMIGGGELKLAETSEQLTLIWIVAGAFISSFPLFSAIYITIFLGNDYSSGFMRNKIIAGHKRWKIFFSAAITQQITALAGIVIYLFAEFVVFALNRNLVGVTSDFIVRFLTLVIAYLSIVALYTAFALVVRRKGITITFSIIFAWSLSTIGMITGYFDFPVSAGETFKENYDKICYEIVDQAPTKETGEDAREYFELYTDSLVSSTSGPAYKFFHTIYTVTNSGLLSDYDIGLFSSGEFGDERNTRLADYYESLLRYTSYVSYGTYDYNCTVIDAKDIEYAALPGMTQDYSTLNTIYITKSLVWVCIWLGGGYLLYRRKNIF